MVSQTFFLCLYISEGGFTPLYSSETLGYWGNWGARQTCPSGEYVYGFQLKSQKDQDIYDESALNGIKLLCTGGGSVTSKIGPFGQWLESIQCNGNESATGFQIQIEERVGEGDDTAANNINLWCRGGYLVKGVANTNWGSWSNLLHCPTGLAIVGIQTRVENIQSCERCDNTALNGVKMLCGDYQSGK